MLQTGGVSPTGNFACEHGKGLCGNATEWGGSVLLPEIAVPEPASSGESIAPPVAFRARRGSLSLRELGALLSRRRKLALGIEGGLLLLCLLYCLIAPKEYDASARVQLSAVAAPALNLGSGQAASSLSVFSAPLAQETIAGELRGDDLAWQVITRLKLYANPGFHGPFARRFPGFNPAAPSPPAQAWLLERFGRRLEVRTVPRTLLIEIRFRSRDPVLSAAVVNELIRAFGESEKQTQVRAMLQASDWLAGQLNSLKQRIQREEERLAEFERTHRIVTTSEFLPSGEAAATEHGSAGEAVDELDRQLIAATTDRILADAEYRAAREGDPETVLEADPHLQAEGGGVSAVALEQIQARRAQLEQEEAQLSAEHGPGFPRVVEIGRQLDDLRHQQATEDAQLVSRFHANLVTAQDREQLVRSSLDAATAEGLRLNGISAQYAAMRQEANASREVYMKVLEKMEEAGFAAGTGGSNLAVVDAARIPVRPATPDMPLYLAITFFIGLWISLGCVYLAELMSPSSLCLALVLLAIAGARLPAQAPTPSTSGLPTGVATFPSTPDTRITPTPNPKEAPPVWGAAETAGVPRAAGALVSTPMAVPIQPGDLLLVTESHLPEFRSEVRVSAAGTVSLPLVSEVAVKGMNEEAAARSIEAALLAKRMLLHPQVNVLVTEYVGEDVSVLGEVQRPGVYTFAYHHRLLDLISAASGLTATAGQAVDIYHASEPQTPHRVLLDPSGADPAGVHNPELLPGDTVQVSRAGLVYVVGDVIRPGGFAIDPAQKLTLVQALSLAWGPSQNAALGKAILIREQKGGRTMTAVNLKRLLEGREPDPLVRDRDILYVPDSLAKNMMNRTLESAIQSTIGVTIYSALVYSQRY